MGRVRIGGNRGRALVAAILALVVAGALVAPLGARSSDDEVTTDVASAGERAGRR